MKAKKFQDKIMKFIDSFHLYIRDQLLEWTIFWAHTDTMIIFKSMFIHFFLPSFELTPTLRLHSRACSFTAFCHLFSSHWNYGCIQENVHSHLFASLNSSDSPFFIITFCLKLLITHSRIKIIFVNSFIKSYFFNFLFSSCIF